MKEAGLQNPVLTNRNGIQRPEQKGKQAHLCDARNQQFCTGRYRRDRGKEFALTRGDLPPSSMGEEVSRGHSSCQPRA
ncbi:MAG: hypothetical protein ACNS62_08990, partial [Candidatus Cyclobacteriaceae bacterium M3_2C_046]